MTEMKRSLIRSANTERRKVPSKEEYRLFREDLEALSEKVGLLRSHFYNHAFNDGTLLNVAQVRK